MRRRSLLARAAAVALILLAGAAPPRASQSRRIVDVVAAGDAKSEHDHDVEGEGMTRGTADHRAYVQAGAWLRATLRTYDDTEVSLACLCGGTSGRRVSFEVLVDGEPAGTKTLESATPDPVLREWLLPERLTRGKAKVSVTLRGIGGPTPRVIELRTVQEHLE